LDHGELADAGVCRGFPDDGFFENSYQDKLGVVEKGQFDLLAQGCYVGVFEQHFGGRCHWARSCRASDKASM
jgi:hypothetical protein